MSILWRQFFPLDCSYRREWWLGDALQLIHGVLLPPPLLGFVFHQMPFNMQGELLKHYVPHRQPKAVLYARNIFHEIPRLICNKFREPTASSRVLIWNYFESFYLKFGYSKKWGSAALTSRVN
jgi:hypothetical protein